MSGRPRSGCAPPRLRAHPCRGQLAAREAPRRRHAAAGGARAAAPGGRGSLSDARLGEIGLRDQGDGRARRRRRRPDQGRADLAGPGDPDHVPGEHHVRPPQRRPRPQPARDRRRLLACPSRPRDQPRGRDPCGRRPARERARAPLRGGLLRGQRRAAAGGLGCRQGEPAPRPRSGHPRRCRHAESCRPR